MRWRASLFALALVSSIAALARAAPVELSVQDCSLSRQELARLVTLELSGVLVESDRSTRFQVQVRCDSTSVWIALNDPLSRKTVQRRVLPPASDQPEPERVIALTVAQLYRAAWLELSSNDAAPLPPAGPAAPVRAVTAARALTERNLAARSGRRWMVGFAVGPRFRQLTAPVLLPHGELRLTSWVSAPLLLFASASAEAASTERQSGSVASRLLGASLGVGFELLRHRPWSAFSETSLGLSHVRLQGGDVAAGYEAGAVSSVGLDGSVGLGLAWQGESARVELASRAGVLGGAPIGLVDPDEDVSLNGPWLGADLRISVFP